MSWCGDALWRGLGLPFNLILIFWGAVVLILQLILQSIGVSV